MAPRGRLRKPRLTRMDAAIDAMQPLGFAKKLVRGRLKNLLKEYGGNEGWPFIEADAYKLLIDTILDEQEEEVKQETCTAGPYLLEDVVDAINKDHDDYGLLESSQPHSLPSIIRSPLPTKRRKPFYGWICSDDEEDDFIELTPALSLATTEDNWGKEKSISLKIH